jgi:hypothetical protein
MSVRADAGMPGDTAAAPNGSPSRAGVRIK